MIILIVVGFRIGLNILGLNVSKESMPSVCFWIDPSALYWVPYTHLRLITSIPLVNYTNSQVLFLSKVKYFLSLPCTGLDMLRASTTFLGFLLEKSKVVIENSLGKNKQPYLDLVILECIEQLITKLVVTSFKKNFHMKVQLRS